MATRSRIAIETPTGVKSIYCHWDGYPSNNGVILQECYRDRAKVEKLIALGAISSLHEEVEPNSREHSWEKPEGGVVVAYHRDRGEALRVEKHSSVQEFIKSDVEEYGYLFTLNGEWLFINGHKKKREAIPLSAVI